jgi:quinol monooxygenase YgiN
MSVLVTMKFHGDTDQFRQALKQRSDEFVQIAGRARTQGALHHRFGVGDGFVQIVDEWESAADFQKFFSDPGLQDFIGSVGASQTPPEINMSEAIRTSDEF